MNLGKVIIMCIMVFGMDLHKLAFAFPQENVHDACAGHSGMDKENTHFHQLKSADRRETAFLDIPSIPMGNVARQDQGNCLHQPGKDAFCCRHNSFFEMKCEKGRCGYQQGSSSTADLSGYWKLLEESALAATTSAFVDLRKFYCASDLNLKKVKRYEKPDPRPPSLPSIS